MAFAQSDLTSLEGLITDGFAKSVSDMRLEYSYVHKDIPFRKEEGQKLGDVFNFPLALTDETSVTYSNADGEIIDYVIGGPAIYKNASAGAVEMFIVGDLPFKATTANKGGVKQYFDGMRTKMENVSRTGVIRIEDSVVWGSVHRAACTVGANITAPTATSIQIVVDEDEFAEAQWLGKEGSLWDAYEATSDASPVNAAAITLAVGGVTLETRTLKFTTSSADSTAINAKNTIYLYPHGSKTGASSFNDMTGIVALLSSASSTIHGVSRDYSLWDTQTFDFGGVVSFSKLCDLVAERIPYGLKGEVKFHCHPKAWNDLMISEAAMVKHDSKYSGEKFYNGANELSFKIQGVTVTPVSNPNMKRGIALLLTMDSWERIGSTDLTFKIDGKETVYALEGNNGIRTVLYSDQGLVCRRPGVNAYCYNLI